LSGRTPELDQIFKWCEKSLEPILSHEQAAFAMLDCASTQKVSESMWALLGGLVKENPTMKKTFANVPRHNGFEAWRKVMEAMNENKALSRNELLPKLTNPRPATSLHDLTQAMEDWETTKRLYSEADGPPLDGEQERSAFVNMLPPDISNNVMMHLEMPGYESYEKIRAYALRLVKVMQTRQPKKPTLNLVGEYGGTTASEESDRQSGPSEAGTVEPDEEMSIEEGIAAIYSMGLAPAERDLEINAFVARKFGRKPGAPAGRFPPRPQGAQSGPKPPPRDRRDMTCANCGRKGHGTGECRQPVVEKSKRPCFVCGKPGHVAAQCREKPAPIKSVTDGRQPAVFLGVCDVVDAEGFKAVRKGLRQNGANFG
jgi:hypothetical protein